MVSLSSYGLFSLLRFLEGSYYAGAVAEAMELSLHEAL